MGDPPSPWLGRVLFTPNPCGVGTDPSKASYDIYLMPTKTFRLLAVMCISLRTRAEHIGLGSGPDPCEGPTSVMEGPRILRDTTSAAVSVKTHHIITPGPSLRGVLAGLPHTTYRLPDRAPRKDGPGMYINHGRDLDPNSQPFLSDLRSPFASWPASTAECPGGLKEL